MKSWKTTLFGALAIAGAGLTQFFHDVPWLFKLGGFLAATCPAIGLLFARDNRVTSEQAGAKPTLPDPAITSSLTNPTPSGQKPPQSSVLGGAASLLAAILIAAPLFLCGCRELDPAGVYRGDKVLYHAELTTTTAYDLIHTFVSWEKDNRVALSTWPEIKEAADAMRRGAPQWFKTAYALRDAYATEPTEQNRIALEKAVAILRTALNEAATYMSRTAEP